MSELRRACVELFAALNTAGIEFAVGGSVASSIHGVSRATLDVDVVVQLPLFRARDLFEALKGSFYIDLDDVCHAIRDGAVFNAIHLALGFKFDLFIAARHPLGGSELARRSVVNTSHFGGDPIEVPVISPEDTILVKLHWYRQGGEVSTRQWNDLVHVAVVQKGRLDLDYLNTQAPRLGVSDLLARLLA